MDGSNPLADGRPTCCKVCDKPVRVKARLPYADDIDLCPIHMEEYINGEASDELYAEGPKADV